MCEYEITSKRGVLGEPLRGYRGLTTGVPEPWSAESGQNVPEARAGRRPKAERPGGTRKKKRRRG